MQQLQLNDKLRVRQFVVSDPPNVFYTESYTTLNNMSSADLQHQMTTTSAHLNIRDYESARLHTIIYYLRHLLVIDNYNPYYPDPDYGFDPYWDVHLYNQNHLLFYHNFHKLLHEIEPDTITDVNALNHNLVNIVINLTKLDYRSRWPQQLEHALQAPW